MAQLEVFSLHYMGQSTSYQAWKTSPTANKYAQTFSYLNHRVMHTHLLTDILGKISWKSLNETSFVF